MSQYVISNLNHYYQIKKREEKISTKVNQHFHQIIKEISSYDNVSKVEVWLSNDVLEEREWNSGTYGGRLLFNIYDYEHDEKPHSVYIDINFESKNFDFEVNKFNIEWVAYDVSTYVYEKMLADKYLAFVKHYEYLFDSTIKNIANAHDNWPGFKDKVGGNMKKLWKDIYDIIFIKNIRTIDMDKVKKYISMMNKRELSLDVIHKFIDIVKNKYPSVIKSRIDYEDISLLVLENYTKLYNKQRKLH